MTEPAVRGLKLKKPAEDIDGQYAMGRCACLVRPPIQRGIHRGPYADSTQRFHCKAALSGFLGMSGTTQSVAG